MAYDEGLAQRVRELLRGEAGISEKEMFGGIGFMLHGNMACGVIGGDLIARVGADRYEETLEEPGARPFDFSGRPMKGWVTVADEALAEDDDLAKWVGWGRETAESLPPK